MRRVFISICVLLLFTGCGTLDSDYRYNNGPLAEPCPYEINGSNYPEILSNLFRCSYGYPESFDTVVMKNADMFDTAFLAHVSNVKVRLGIQARQDAELCNSHVDPTWVSECLNERPAAMTLLWISSLELTITSGALWSQTPYGSLVFRYKHSIEAMLGPHAWRNITNQFMEMAVSLAAYLQ